MADQADPTTSTNAEMQASETRSDNNTVDLAEDHTSEVTKKRAEAAESEETDEAPKTNGAPSYGEEEKIDEASEKAADLSANTHEIGDTEMTDIAEPSEPTEAPASPVPPPTNGTPASSKRASGGGSARKKSSAVPEHKSKKLHKKKSKSLTNLTAQPGEYYIARMKGHPPWPSIICDEDMLPSSLLGSRPVTAQLPDGSFKKPEYADGGKRAYERTYPIMFLHTNEFAWIPNTELSLLDVHSDVVKTPIEKGKSKTLLQAYKKAADNEDLNHFKGMLADHQKALEADLQEREELDKERAAKKAKKGSRKSDVLVNDDDEMDVDEDVVPEKPKSKKRKKAEDSEDVDEKSAKTPKTATKLKLSTPKTPAAEPSTKKKSSKSTAAKATKSGSEDDAVTPKVEEKPLTPQQAKEIKEKKVLYYRHKLQRGFLTRDATPKEEEMKAMSDFLGELESYPDLEGSIIRATKIHKVLKAMIKLPSIPLDEEFKFKTRSVELLAKWNEILSHDNSAGPSGDKEEEGKAEDAGPESAPTTNGTSKVPKEQGDEAEDGAVTVSGKDTEAKVEDKELTSLEGDKEIPEAEEAATADHTDAPAIDSAPGEEYKPNEVNEATA